MANILLNALETLYVNTKKVACDGLREGQSVALGHPLVYLNMGQKSSVVCPYCSKNFTLNEAKNDKTKIAKNFGEKK